MDAIIQNFTQQIGEQGAFWFLIFVSFLGGIIASISPCTLGILPVIIGYIGGYDKEKAPVKTAIKLVSFVFGLSAILTVIGMFCALTGKVFISALGNYPIIIMASLIMIFGLNLLGVVEIPIPNFVKRMPKSEGGSLFVYPFVLGILFALAATPCSTPVLAAIMSFATLSKDILYASCLLLMFSLGQGVIIILAGMFAAVLKNLKSVNQYSGYLMKFCGLLLIFASLLIFYKVFSVFIN